MDVGAMSRMAGGLPITTPALSEVPKLPDDRVVEDFNGALNGPAQPAAAAAAAPAHEAESPTPVAPARTIGDAILAGIHAYSSDLRGAWQAIRTSGPQEGEALSVARLVQLQAHIVEFSVLSELVGKGVSKAVQDLDALVKMQ